MRLYVYLIGFALMLFSCQHESKNDIGFNIRGELTGNYSEYVYLNYVKYGDSTYTIKDSAKVTNNIFSFKGIVDYPTQAWLNLKPSSGITWLFLENSNITIKGNYFFQGEGQNTYRNIEIDTIFGSESQSILNDFKAFYQEFKNDPNFSDKYYRKIKNIAIENPKNGLSGKILADALVSASHLSYKQAKEIYKIIDINAQGGDDLRLIKTGLEKLSKLGLGKQIIDINLPNTDGYDLSLKSYRGKTTLVDFWASWCAPCRKKHPEYRSIYKAYKNKGFDILSVSIDTSEEKWKQAIALDSIEWNNVIDNQGFKGKTAKDFYLEAIPASYLIDNNGIIIEINPSTFKINSILENQ